MTDAQGQVDRPRERGVAVALIVLALWFVLQAVLRVFAAPSLGIDEAQLMMHSRTLELGYGPQPPLYAWLQHGIFAVFGISLFALALTKQLMLLATFVLMFLSARMVLGRPGWALVVALLLFTIPQIGWEAQRTLSHSVLVLLLASLALYLMLRVLRDGRPLDYLLFGLCVGLGLLSKYNFALFAVALMVAALPIETLRRRVLSPWLLGALGLALLVALPHFWWATTHMEQMLSSTDKFEIDASPSVLNRIIAPVLAVLEATVGFAAVTAVVVAGVAYFPGRGRGRGRTPASVGTGSAEGRRYILNLALVAIVAVALLTLGSGATEVRDRWLLPVLFFLPLALLLLLERRLTRRRLAVLAGISIFCAVLCSAGLFVTTRFPDLTGKEIDGTQPFRLFAATIVRDTGAPDIILANDGFIAGNFRLHFPQAFVSSGSDLPVAEGQARVVAVWRGDGELPEGLRGWLTSLCGAEAAAAEPVHLRELLEGSERQYYGLSYLSVPECAPPEASGASGV